MKKIRLTKENYEKLVTGEYLLLTNSCICEGDIISVDGINVALIVDYKTMMVIDCIKPNSMVIIKDKYVSNIGYQEGEEYSVDHKYTKINEIEVLIKTETKSLLKLECK